MALLISKAETQEALLQLATYTSTSSNLQTINFSKCKIGNRGNWTKVFDAVLKLSQDFKEILSVSNFIIPSSYSLISFVLSSRLGKDSVKTKKYSSF